MAEDMIRAEGLTKEYGNFLAISEVSFQVRSGTVAAFLGPNGAGKSTTMKILTGYLSPTRGQAWIGGINVADDRLAVAGKVGYLPENGPLYEDMTPMGLLRFFGEARGVAALGGRIDAVIEACALQSVRHKRIDKLSRGFRQRVCLSQALLHEPEVLILDEPTSGLDPNQARQVRDTLKTLSAKTTILLSTHLMQEVTAMADQVIVIDQGRIRFDGTPKEFEKPGESLEEVFYELTRGEVAGGQ